MELYGIIKAPKFENKRNLFFQVFSRVVSEQTCYIFTADNFMVFQSNRSVQHDECDKQNTLNAVIKCQCSQILTVLLSLFYLAAFKPYFQTP